MFAGNGKDVTTTSSLTTNQWGSTGAVQVEQVLLPQPDLLKLDVKSIRDPDGTNGAMYYNENTNFVVMKACMG